MIAVTSVMAVVALAAAVGLVICSVKVGRLISLVARLSDELQTEKSANAQRINIMCEKIDDIDEIACAAHIWVTNNGDKVKDALAKVEKHESLYDKQEEVLDEELKGQKLFNEGFSNLMNYTGVVKTDE